MFYRISTVLVLKRKFTTKLVDVGRLEPPSVVESYKPGQMFLHRLLGYRGVILFAWRARVFDRDKSNELTKNVEQENNEYAEKSAGSCRTQSVFYNGLVDLRDRGHVRCHPLTATFHADDSRVLSPIPGLDYVSHGDVVPYTSTDKQPLEHELVEQLFVYKQGRVPLLQTNRGFMIKWLLKNRPWLEVCEVHKETTDNVKITVVPFFMNAQNQGFCSPKQYWWRYLICLENLGETTVHLTEISEFWRTLNSSKALRSLWCRGVLGEEPALSPNSPAFQYVNYISLATPRGLMWGTLRMMRQDGEAFDCKIPKFGLKSRKQIVTSGSETE